LLIGASRRQMLAFAREADIIGLEDRQWPQRDLHASAIPVASHGTAGQR
jgi:hypothetical protein